MKKYWVIISVLLILIILAVIVFQNVLINNLCLYIESGNTEQATKLLPGIINVNGYSAPIIIRPILNRMDIDIKIPLVVACRSGNYEMVEKLLKIGADPNKYLNGNFSPLEAAFIENNENRFQIAELLISYGADVNLHGSIQSPLFLELSRLTYLSGDDAEQHKICCQSIILLLQNGANTTNDKGDTIVHYLAAANEVTLLNELMPFCKEHLNVQNNSGETPIMWAMEENALEAKTFLETRT